MRVVAFEKLLTGNPRNPNYLLAWAVLTFAIALVIFLVMQLWIACAIVGAALGVSVLFMGYPGIPPELMTELEDEEGEE